MPTSNPLDILLAHSEWANRNMLEACSKLTPEQFHQKFEMGRGSLHNNVVHILAATRAWGDMLASRETRPRVDAPGSHFTPAEIGPLFEEVTADFAATAKAHPTDESVTGIRAGKSYTFTRGAVLTHVTTHAMHHRAQCLNMLRQIGVNPLPPSAVVEWMLMADKQG